ncbi:MAG: hypothetical protein EZS28_012936 [Streblomastix strix]|uniref:Cyclin N-terminal domain-containing protein n=1 Tax=Streblomastix strix TaxID=222440 RepID=A0A5J4WA48_9EUKA|nr:MAG: hypothetical protein EZS28_012936 [Streblomastix strix]
MTPGARERQKEIEQLKKQIKQTSQYIFNEDQFEREIEDPSNSIITSSSITRNGIERPKRKLPPQSVDAMINRLSHGNKIILSPKKQVELSKKSYKWLPESNIKDNDMVAIIGACLLLSSKVEEQRREVDDIAFVVGSKKEDVETSEIVLLTALKFNLVVWHPTRPADGALLDLKNSTSDRFAIFDVAVSFRTIASSLCTPQQSFY